MNIARCWRGLWSAALALAFCVGASAATLQVLPGDSLAGVLSRAADGDTVLVGPGEHRGQTAVIERKQLTLRGLPGAGGGRPVLHAGGKSAEGKAILVVRGGDVRIENIEFRGARVFHKNGAGIRFERGRLAISNCAFVDNENGILAGNVGDAELQIEGSHFADAPEDTPLPHLLYVGRIGKFTLTDSHFSGGRAGHLVKSRARENHVYGNTLVDGPAGSAAYELEFPEGGLAWVVGNVIAQAAGTTNPAIVSFGAEGAVDGRGHGLFMSHNTLVNHGLRPAIFVRVHPLQVGMEMRLVNNLVVGPGSGPPELSDANQGNFRLESLPRADRGEYALAPDSPLHGRAVAAGEARGVALRPPGGSLAVTGARASPGAIARRWSPGALQQP